MEKGLNRHFSKEDIQMANKHMKRCSTLLIIKNQNYNEISPHTSQNGHHKKVYNKKCFRGCGQKGALLHCWWECKLIQPLWTLVWTFIKALGINYPYDPPISLLSTYPEKTTMEKIHTPNVHYSTVYNSHDMEAT